MNRILILLSLCGASLAGATPFTVRLDPHDAALKCHSALSPSLTFGTPPTGTKSLAVVFWDQQPRRLTGRWLVYDLPTSVRALPARPIGASSVAGGTVGPNSLKQIGFTAPCDAGARDLYVDLYALNTAKLPVPRGASFAQIHTIIHQYRIQEARAHLKWAVK